METFNPVPPFPRGVRGDLGLNKSQGIIENCYILGQEGTGIDEELGREFVVSATNSTAPFS